MSSQPLVVNTSSSFLASLSNGPAPMGATKNLISRPPTATKMAYTQRMGFYHKPIKRLIDRLEWGVVKKNKNFIQDHGIEIFSKEEIEEISNIIDKLKLLESNKLKEYWKLRDSRIK